MGGEDNRMEPPPEPDLIAGIPSTPNANGSAPLVEMEQNFLLAAIVESSDDAIVSKDLSGIIRSWNKGAERIFGYRADEVLGRPVSILAPLERLNEMPEILARIRRGERIDHYETVRRRKDGRSITVSVTISPVRNRNGEVVGASKIARDITESKKLQESLQAFDLQLMLLADASSALLASPETSDVLRTIIGLAQRFGSADGYAIWRKNNDDAAWTLVSSTGLSQEYVDTGVTRTTGDSDLPSGPLAFEDVSREPFLALRHDALKREGICSMLVVPLHVHGKPTGTVTFYWKSPHRFTDSEMRIAAALGNMAAAALGTAELYERERVLRSQAQIAEQRAAFLAEAGAVLSRSLEYETTLRSVAQLAIPTFADWCAVDVYRNGILERVALEHIDAAKVQLAREYGEKYPARQDDLSQVVFRAGQAVLVEQIPEELLAERIRDPEQLRMIRAMGIESLMITPMVNRERSLGLLTFVSSRPGLHYTNADLSLAQELARRAAMAIDNARLYADVRASEERYRSLVSATTSIVWTINPAGEFTEPQASWEAYTGQTWEEHRGFGWAAALHPEDCDWVRAEWVRSRDEGKTYEAEGRLWHARSGTYRYFVARAAPVKNAQGSICEWIGTVTDIHESKEAEEERKALLAREQQARHTAQLLNRVGQTLSAELEPRTLAKSVTDLATKLVNAEFGALFHNVTDEHGESYTLYTLSGAPYEAFANFPMPRNTAVFGPTFRGEGVVRSDDITEDPRYGKNSPYRGMPDGHLPVRSYLAVPITSRSGEVLGGLFFGHSERGIFQEQAEEFAVGIASQAAIALDNARLFARSQEAQNALWRTNQELRRANEDLNHFAYSASHDLQEPLRMVSAYSQLLQKRYRGRLDMQADQYIAYAVQGAQRMEALVRDILAYTQAANIDDKEAGPVNANAVLEQVLSNLQQAIERSGATVKFGQLPMADIAEIHLVQVFQNLISNSIKYASNSP
ncbi:MAG: hypothetical protein JWP08_4404, partial [Bryobacterales bacterium]|nr:hypothetical protein [Bryobacterales bacterium]